MSVLPKSFFKYFSKHPSVNRSVVLKKLLARSPLLNLIRCDPENTEHLDHYLNDYIRHFRRRCYRGVDFETSKKTFDALENVNKSVLACANILSRLTDIGVTMGCAEV
jgi:hypothetical protein